MPCRTSSVDVVTALQVVEHLWEQPRFVRSALGRCDLVGACC